MLGTRRGGDPTVVSLLFLITFTTFVCGIDVPDIVKGEAGNFITITATTTGKTVKWVPIDKGLSVFPTSMLADKKSTVVFAKDDGEYRLLAYTVEGGEPTEPKIIKVKIGSAPVPVPPGPGPADPLTLELQKIYDGISDKDKRAHLTKLTLLYEGLPKFLKTGMTVGQFVTAWSNAAEATLPRSALEPIRRRIATDLDSVLSTDEKAALDVPRLTAMVEKYAAALRGVK